MIKPEDTKDELICPACSAIMKKIFVESANCYVDICTDGCGGIWFDNREMEKFDEKHEDIDKILKELADKKFMPVLEQKRWCPVCASPLVKNFTSLDKRVQIDECYNCGGRFLDHNELLKIREEYATVAMREQAAESGFKQKYNQAIVAQELELQNLKQRPSFYRFIRSIF